MTDLPNWIFAFIEIDRTLISAAYLVGLVITLRRWHLGIGARLGAVGFGLILLSTVGMQIVHWLTVREVYGFGGSESFRSQVAVLGSLSSLFQLTGVLLIALGLRSTLQEISRLHSEPYSLKESDLR